MTAISELDTLAPASLKDIGIAILIELATRGEIDPWDVQVIDVIDRYLSQLALISDAEPGRPYSMFQSGQAFLWASMLVLLKADTLGRPEIPDANLDSTDDEEAVDGLEGSQLPAHLERHLRRRPSAQPPQKRPVTLQELIDQLRQMTAELEEKPSRPRSRRPKPQSPTQAARAIAELAHDENLTETAGELDRFLTAHWPRLAQDQDWLNLEQLLELWSLTPASIASQQIDPHSERSQAHDRVGVFWALLLLSAQSKVELLQEEFYQDIKIRTLSGDD